MTGALYVAAGGGGDAIAAAILANRENPGETAHIATYAWDRLIIDPLPGPRSAQDFDNLTTHAPHVWEITKDTTPRLPAGSTLPRLSHELNARLFLLDPYSGAIGMAQQLRSVARFLNASSLNLVDIGGDLVANGDEPELRSPFADFLSLAGCELTGLPYRAIVAGPGVDGELTEHQVIARCQTLLGDELSSLSALEVKDFTFIHDWHPSEATGLWTASARGHRGSVEIRDAGIPVNLTDRTPKVFSISQQKLRNLNPLVEKLKLTKSLTDAEYVIRTTRGTTEIDYEREKVARIDRLSKVNKKLPTPERVIQVSKKANNRVDYLTVRRIAELITLPSKEFAKLPELLRSIDPSRLDSPLWAVQ